MHEVLDDKAAQVQPYRCSIVSVNLQTTICKHAESWSRTLFYRLNMSSAS